MDKKIDTEPTFHFKALVPLLVILLLMGAFYLSGAYHLVSIDNLRESHKVLKEAVGDNPFLAPLIFIAFFTGWAGLSIPFAFVLTIIGGFLFPQPYCTLYALIGAILGGTILFLAARTALRDLLYRKTKPLMQRLAKGFERGAANYLLFLRFAWVFPFWFTNLAAAFFNVPLKTFLWTLTVGVLPEIFILAQAGRGLRIMIEQGHPFTLEAIFNPQMQVALILLVLFSLIPLGMRFIWPKK